MVVVLLVVVALLAVPAVAEAGSQYASPRWHDSTGWARCNVVGSTEPESYFVRVRSFADCREGTVDPYSLAWAASCHREEGYLGYVQLTAWATHDDARYGDAWCHGRSYFTWAGSGLYTGITKFRLDLGAGTEAVWDAGPNFHLSDPGYREIRTGPNGKVMLITLWSRWSG
jgi:hypothetical protein